MIGPGDHQALRMDALDREVGDDPIEVPGLAEDRDVVHAAPARGARILDDADHPRPLPGAERTAPTNRAAIGPQP